MGEGKQGEPIKVGKSRATGTAIELWRVADLAGYKADEGIKYVLRCVDHEYNSPFAGQRAARDTFSHPERWCFECAQGSPAAQSIAELLIEFDVLAEPWDESDTSRRRLTETATLKAGDVIKVKGEHGTFVVQYVDQFRDPNRTSEVTAIGGTSGHSQWRTFTIDKIKVQRKSA
jgi:hypothetical protein